MLTPMPVMLAKVRVYDNHDNLITTEWTTEKFLYTELNSNSTFIYLGNSICKKENIGRILILKIAESKEE